MTGEMLWTNDIKEELSLAYVHAVVSQAGFSFETIRKDRDSVDVMVRARGRICEDATLESPMLDLQLKATVMEPLPSEQFPFDVPAKNYNDLVGRTTVPRLLVVYVMPERSEDWASWNEDRLVLRRSAYWTSLCGQPRTQNTSTQRIYVSRRNVFEPTSIRHLLTRVAREEGFAS
ncbi:MAG TPA: DUF4365 domain-containing protein [Polyangiaceae bacterium]|nr:DUF4365 domain-containing protein [Polyangiaceae bacterium]